MVCVTRNIITTDRKKEQAEKVRNKLTGFGSFDLICANIRNRVEVSNVERSSTVNQRNIMAFKNGQCIRDQYGHNYILKIDTERQYITGTVSGGQGGGPWILTGSYVNDPLSDRWIFELTVTNTHGTGQANKVPVFKLKGVEPKAAWYYDSGYGNQEFEFTYCSPESAQSAEIVEDSEPLKPGEFRGVRFG